MNRYMHEEYYRDPELFRRLAHRERNRAIGEATVWLFEGAARIFARAVAWFKPHRPTHWIARLG